MTKERKVELAMTGAFLSVVAGAYVTATYMMARPYIKDWKQERKEKKQRKGFIKMEK